MLAEGKWLIWLRLCVRHCVDYMLVDQNWKSFELGKFLKIAHSNFTCNGEPYLLFTCKLASRIHTQRASPQWKRKYRKAVSRFVLFSTLVILNPKPYTLTLRRWYFIFMLSTVWSGESNRIIGRIGKVEREVVKTWSSLFTWFPKSRMC
jgi:hypothetical protein